MSALQILRRLTGLRWWSLIPAVLSGALTLLAAGALTVVSAWLITRAAQMPPILELSVAVTAVRALGVSRAVFRYASRLTSHDIALQAAARARVRMFRALAAAEEQQVSGLRRGDFLARAGADVDTVADVIVRVLIPVGVAAVCSAAAVGFAAALHPGAALVLALGLAIAAVLAPWLVGRGAVAAERARAAAQPEYARRLEAILTDAATLRVRGTLDEHRRGAHAAAQALAAADAAAAPAGAAGRAVATAARLGSALLVLLVAVWAGGAAGHSAQWLAVLALLPLAAFEACEDLPEAAITWARARGALSRLDEMTAGHGAAETAGAATSGRGTDPDSAGSASRPGADRDVGSGIGSSADPAAGASAEAADLPPRLVARDLRWGRATEIGHADRIVLEPGHRYLLTGPNGVGKTTLLRTLAGGLPARGGTVRLESSGAAGSGPGPVREDRVSPATVLYCPADGHLFATTVRDNLLVGAPYARDEEVAGILETVGLADWAAGLPHGLDTVLTSGADSVSGGQRARLLVARALLTEAPILLLDEPTAHLDAAAEAALLELLAAPQLPGRRAIRTVVVVRHQRLDDRGAAPAGLPQAGYETISPGE